ncbi:uncharacterized protein LOC126883792 [Diabrotica virgifera virgifera]|uniref:Reverse transcriptase domain-containing protein n=1 Tax=Diabrotica virgifera virgifera TaxID=50390 RepID=A0ABM5K5G4_DIAVI|nr:uncharacterized protein LOC126883792 [Diabrotica virgifera virgifera]
MVTSIWKFDIDLLYGVPKVHKTGGTLRPILSSINTPNYLLAKYLFPHLQILTENEFTVKYTFSFAKEITNQDRHKDGIMVSFDVESLFTNVPLDETINIIINSLFPSSNSNFLGMEQSKFKDLLTLAAKECLFSFDGKVYRQIDDVVMGSPLGPVFANTFLCHHEKTWLADCPIDFKPLLYRRYVDDIFLIFKHTDHIQHFLDYLNQKHHNIKFTVEIEVNGNLPFLGINIFRSPSGFSTSIYRKPIFTGLYINADSFIPNKHKTSLINILVHRAFTICST